MLWTRLLRYSMIHHNWIFRTIKLVLVGILTALACVLSFCTEVTIPVFLVLVGLKVFYPPYTLGWAATVIIPLGGGLICLVLGVITAVVTRVLADDI